jgi:dihydrodipicolinate synthase/N-acetylneuraminate lyase
MVKEKKYHGVVIPMVTPFTANGDIDMDAAGRIVEHIAGAGACPFALGTTGEAASIRYSVKAEFVETVVKKHAHRTIVFAGISDNSLANSVELAKQFFDLGVDVVVAHVPSYYPLTGDDILGYYEKLAGRIGGPLMLYNIPITTGVTIPLEVIDRLSSIATIIGLKDSVNDVERAREAIALWKDREDFSYLMGSTPLSRTALALGADGVVPSVGNVVPDLFCKLYNAVLNGNSDEAEQCQRLADGVSDIFHKNRNLTQALPVLKAMMHILGFCGPKVLPPLRDLTAEQISALREAVKDMLNR